MDSMKVARAERLLVYMSAAQLRALKALARRTITRPAHWLLAARQSRASAGPWSDGHTVFRVADY